MVASRLQQTLYATKKTLCNQFGGDGKLASQEDLNLEYHGL